MSNFLDFAVTALTTACVKAKGAIDDRNEARVALLTAAVFYKRPDLFVMDGPDGLPIPGVFFQHLKKVAGISLKPTRGEIRICENVRRIMESEEWCASLDADAAKDAAKADADAKADKADAGKVRNAKASA
jgi:hypothetical protein